MTAWDPTGQDGGTGVIANGRIIDKYLDAGGNAQDLKLAPITGGIVNQLDIARIIKIIVRTFKILKIELLNENIIIFSTIIAEPNNVLCAYTFKKWNININIKLENSNFPKFGIKVNIDLIGREILIIDWVIGLLAFALNIDKRILKVNINIKKDRIKSTMKKPSSGNEFDII